MNSLFHWAGCLSAGRFHRRSFVLQGRHRVYATCPARGHHERWRRTEKSAEDSRPRVTEVRRRPEDRRFTLTDYVSPRYFDTVGMRFLRRSRRLAPCRPGERSVRSRANWRRAGGHWRLPGIWTRDLLAANKKYQLLTSCVYWKHKT